MRGYISRLSAVRKECAAIFRAFGAVRKECVADSLPNHTSTQPFARDRAAEAEDEKDYNCASKTIIHNS
jgi:uncharacterized protein YbaA (DUF1428 family)